MNCIRLSNEVFEGRNNVYCLDAGDPVTLIDTGIGTASTRATLTDELRAHGLTMAEVDQVLLTHWHADHVGLAGAIQQKGDATVYIHERDAPMVDADAWTEIRELYERRFEEWGMPPAKGQELIERMGAETEDFVEPVEVETFTDGATFEAGGETLEAIHAPGHTDGLTCFAFESDGRREVFTGDAILPVYTPNVGGADVRVADPLQTYLDTLVRLIEGDFDRAYPGHRHAIEDPSKRAREILTHHRERTENVLDVLADHGPLDAWSVSAHLFGELSGIHVLHGPGEADAHLHHLAEAGAVQKAGRTYSLIDPDVDVDAMFPTFDRVGE